MIAASELDAERFSPFGSVASFPTGTPLAATGEFKFWSDVASYQIGESAEISYCEVAPRAGNRITWMERHERTPELLVPIDGRLILPVMTDGGLADVLAFSFGPGDAIVIGRNVWHSACLPIGDDPVRYFVIFRRGTPHDDVIKAEISPVSVLPANQT